MRRLTDREERNFFAAMISRRSLRAGIKRRLAVHHEHVVMMPVRHGHIQAPRPVGLPLHGVRGGFPIVEIAHYTYCPGFGRPADEADRLNGFFGGIPIRIAEKRLGVHWG